MANAKQWQVRKGYVWVDEKGNGTTRTLILDNEKGFDGQKYKLEPVPDEPTVVAETEAEMDGAAVATADRMVKTASRKR